jgi:hypothetical protein
MDRRDFLKTGGFAAVGAFAPQFANARNNNAVFGGWIPNKGAVEVWANKMSRPFFSQQGQHLIGSGKGRRIFLWKFLERAMGKRLVPHDQGIGDCVGQGWGRGVDVLTAVQIFLHNRPERWVAEASTESIYVLSRMEVGGGRIRGDGSHGVWAAEAVREYGVLLRQSYLAGKYDFTEYSSAKARSWAHKCRRCTSWGGGLPDELEPVAKEHPVRTTTLVTSWEQARDAIANGYPVVLCSNQGFDKTRDDQGFLTPRGKWYHCMLLAGIDTISKRHGGLIINSWGENWVDGPTQWEQPSGSFWAEPDVIDSMLKQEDSFALSNYKGYPGQNNLDYRLY